MTGDRQPWWQYRADIDADSCYRFGVVDGDTLDIVVDLGLSTLRPHRVRLRGVDTAEIYGVEDDSDEYTRGIEHTQFVQAWLQTALEDGPSWPLIVQTEQDESGKYGRYVAHVRRRSDDAVLTDDLIAEYPEVTDGD